MALTLALVFAGLRVPQAPLSLMSSIWRRDVWPDAKMALPLGRRTGVGCNEWSRKMPNDSPDRLPKTARKTPRPQRHDQPREPQLAEQERRLINMDELESRITTVPAGPIDYAPPAQRMEKLAEDRATAKVRRSAMIKSKLIQRISWQNPHLYQRDIEKIVQVILDALTTAMARGDRIELRGFGSFGVKSRSARTGLNPRTGAYVSVEKK